MVVAMMGQRQPFAVPQVFGEGGVTRTTCRGFDALPTRIADLNANCGQRHFQCLAKIGAMSRPRRAVGVQSMIDVQRAQAAFARFR